MKIGVVGGGFVGRSWALLFAKAGHQVAVFDQDATVLKGVHALIAPALEELLRHGLLDEAPAAVLARIETAATLPAAVREADYVQENAPETLELKRELFASLDRHSPPEAVLASSSSGLTCSAVCEALPGRARCIVAHPANPPHLLRAVEVVPAPFTSERTTHRTVKVLQGSGQVPVVIGEVDGFVMNRLQAALANEALALVAQGVADADAIDTILRFSLGPRWAFMGPFQTMDLNAPGGFADYADRYGPGFAAVGGRTGWPVAAVDLATRSLRARTPLGALKASRAWRDGTLAALVAHLAKIDPAPA